MLSLLLDPTVTKRAVRLASTIVGHEHAEDIIQELSIKALQGTVRMPEPTLAGVLFATRCLALDYRRKLKSKMGRLSVQLENQDAPIDTCRADVKNDLLARLATIYRTSSPARRSILDALKTGATYAETAERLNMPLSTVKTHVRRMRLGQ